MKSLASVSASLANQVNRLVVLLLKSVLRIAIFFCIALATIATYFSTDTPSNVAIVRQIQDVLAALEAVR